MKKIYRKGQLRGFVGDYVAVRNPWKIYKETGIPLVIKSFDNLESDERQIAYRKIRLMTSLEKRPGYLHVYMNVKYSIMMLDGSSFRKADVVYLISEYSAMGLSPLPLVSEAKNGLIHLAEADELKNFLVENGYYEQWSKLSTLKKLSRIGKLFQTGTRLEGKVELTENERYPGLIYLSLKMFVKYQLPFGVKFTGPLKGIGVPIPDSMKDICTADVNIPKGENKLKFGAAELENHLLYRPEISADMMFSRVLKNHASGMSGRLAKFGLDYMFMLGLKPDLSRLDDFRRIYNRRKWDREAADKLFLYMENGLLNWDPLYPEFLKAERHGDKDLFKYFHKALARKSVASLEGTMPSSIYGTLIPLEYVKEINPKVKVKKCWFLRWPAFVFVETEYVIYHGCICVPSAVIKLYGGDSDGDLGLIVHRSRMEWCLKFNRDHVKLHEWMKAPVKVESTDELTHLDAFKSILAHQEDCGKVFNSLMTAADQARAMGWDSITMCEFVLKAYARYVQPKIDGFKYHTEDEDEVTASFICREFGINDMGLSRRERFIMAVKAPGSSLDKLIATARYFGASALAKGYYEPICARFATFELSKESWEFWKARFDAENPNKVRTGSR